jgi:hypothetical protein
VAKKSKSLLKQRKSFSGSQILLFTLVFAAVGAVAIWQSLAAPHNGGGGGKPPKGGSGTISLAMVTDQNSDGLPNYGDTITFNISTTATTIPSVSVNCHQGTTLVLSTSAGYFPSYPWPDSKNVPLTTGAWPGGAADCIATLYYTSPDGTRQYNLATLSFHVNA